MLEINDLVNAIERTKGKNAGGYTQWDKMAVQPPFPSTAALLRAFVYVGSSRS